MEPSAELVAATLKKEAFAHLITGPVLMLLVVGPLIRWANPAASNPADIPHFAGLWKQFTICFLFNENMFYWGHRTLHAKQLYKHIHKQHHTYIGTRSFAAEYAHELEDVLTAYIPFLTGLLLTGAHFHVAACWFFCRLTETYEAHSGYCFKHSWLNKIGLTHSGSAAHHDFHHTCNKGNFGWAVLDYAFGTMDAWVALGGTDGYLAQPAVAASLKAE
jgi:sterol desaturase/sphingolipid hydroxylase (fatty acid hydroxylase superfamily)